MGYNQHGKRNDGHPPRTLVIGFGNPGRRDDGLGPAFAARLEALGLRGITVESSYQLSIEHAHLAAQFDVVVFVDAAVDVNDDASFYLHAVQPDPSALVNSHSLSPQAVLHLASECFGTRPTGWLLGIRPLELNVFGEGLSPGAEANLTAALNAFRSLLQSGQLWPRASS